LDKSKLPFQQGLVVSNRVADTDMNFMLLNAEEIKGGFGFNSVGVL